MTLAEARAAIGRRVMYIAQAQPDVEYGVIASVTDIFVFVRYGVSPTAVATRPQDLAFADGGPAE